MATLRRERMPILLNHHCLWYLSIMVNVSGLDPHLAIDAYAEVEDYPGALPKDIVILTPARG